MHWLHESQSSHRRHFASKMTMAWAAGQEFWAAVGRRDLAAVRHSVEVVGVGVDRRESGIWTALHRAAEVRAQGTAAAAPPRTRSAAKLDRRRPQAPQHTYRLNRIEHRWCPEHWCTAAALTECPRNRQAGEVELADLLLQLGAAIDATTRLGGETALVLACWQGHVPVVQLLLAAGADPSRQTANGVTALQAALSQHHHDVAEMVRRVGTVAPSPYQKISAEIRRGVQPRVSIQVADETPPPAASPRTPSAMRSAGGGTVEVIVYAVNGSGAGGPLYQEVGRKQVDGSQTAGSAAGHMLEELHHMRGLGIPEPVLLVDGAVATLAGGETVTDTPFPSILKHLLKGEGGAAE